jgi:hypothetical protein
MDSKQKVVGGVPWKRVFGFNHLHKRRLTMPVIINGTPMPPTAPPPRRHSLDDEVVRELAPIIAEIRKAADHRIWRIAMRLEEFGILGPSGVSFTYETTRRILKRIKSLGLGDGPQTVSAALRARHARERARHAMELAELEARMKREHPDWN